MCLLHSYFICFPIDKLASTEGLAAGSTYLIGLLELGRGTYSYFEEITFYVNLLREESFMIEYLRS